MKVAQQERFNGFTDIYKLTAAEITSLGTGAQKTIAILPPGGIVTSAAVFEQVTFAGTSTDLLLDVGTTTADPNEYIDSLDLDGLTKAAFNTGASFTVGGDANTGNGVVNNSASALPIVIEANFTGTVTAGEWLIALTILDPGNLASNA
jgi:hypothetical protein